MKGKLLKLSLLTALVLTFALRDSQALPPACPNHSPYCTTMADCATYCMGITADPSNAECRNRCCLCWW